jgi:predicted transcriptional regulator
VTTALTIRLHSKLARDLEATAKSQRTNPSSVLRRMMAEYVHETKPVASRMQEHIRA